MIRRRPRGRGPKFGNLLLFVIAVVVLWWIGLVRFVEEIPAHIVDVDSKSGAIVVLTGGSGRLDAGLDLLDSNNSSRLFVSGVYKGMEVRQLLELSSKGRANLESRIAIGNAENTRENAAETAAWIVGKHISSLRLVTAAYHMPRSLLEFENAMPDVYIIPNPVFPTQVKQERWWLYPGTAMLISNEFNKFLIAWIRIEIDRLFVGQKMGEKLDGLFKKIGKSVG